MLNRRFSRSLNRSKILVLGIAYKKDIKDVRESPSLDVINLLAAKGARVSYNDPFVPKFQWNNKPLKSVKLTEAVLKQADLVVVLTNHTQYDYQWIVNHAKAVFDTRNATKHVQQGRKKIELL
jgi:UDP-N-acetyl-D-mannosaminuronate dehydrogenase